MSRSKSLRLRDIRAVYTLLGEVTDIGTNPHAWRGHVLERLCQLTDGRVGITLELHNLLLNRSPMSIDPIDIGFGGPVERLVFVRYMASDARAVDPSTVALCTFQPQRRFLTVRRQEIVGNAQWYGSPMTSEARRSSNVDHFLCSIYRLNHSGSTTGFILYKSWGEEPFDDRSRNMVRLFHSELLKKVVRPSTAHGCADLPPHLIQLLQCLLAGCNSKTSADRLGLSINTVKSYTKNLYERVGVRSRGQLLAHYLNRPGQRPIILPPGLNR
ncbi:MAG TPA: helix-turn-helix transcriptional regulator [Tepidisphaeraceae bacterium]|nr:helix-turn-helix transcriptional regulator [Tepidisphaeraceae bacterium]